jgi:Leucine-rich repeat (LRR) protein
MTLSELLKARMEKNSSNNEILTDMTHFNTELKFEFLGIEKEKKVMENEAIWIERSLVSLEALYIDLTLKWEVLKEAKSQVIKMRYDNEIKDKKRELELISAVLKKRRQEGVVCDNIGDLDVVTLEGKDLTKLPQMLLQIKNAKILSLANNDLLSAERISELRNLEFLNLNRNLLDTLDVSGMNQIKMLSISGNRIKTLIGIHDGLTFLDASCNPLVNLNFLSNATSLSVGM